MEFLIIKDSLRELSKNIGKFIAILSLMFISVLAFTGIYSAVQMLFVEPNTYYNDINLKDIKITSTYGFDDDDLEIISSDSNILDWEESYFTDIKSNNNIIRLDSIPEDISKLELLVGTMPKKDNQILLSEKLRDTYSIGDIFEIDDTTKDDHLVHNRFIVTGFINSGEYLSDDGSKQSIIGGGSIHSYGYLMPAAFDMEYPPVIKLKVSTEQDIYTDRYKEDVDRALASLKSSLEQRPEDKLTEIKTEATDALDEQELQLDRGKSKLKSQETLLLDSKKDINLGKQRINEKEQELKKARTELDNGWLQYQKGKDQYSREIKSAEGLLTDAKNELNRAKKQLDQEGKKLKQGQKQYQLGINILDKESQSLQENENLLNQKIKEWESGYLEYQKGKKEYQRGVQKLESSILLYEQGLSEYQAGLKELEQNKSLFNLLERLESILKISGYDLSDLSNLITNADIESINDKQLLAQYEKSIADLEKKISDNNLKISRLDPISDKQEIEILKTENQNIQVILRTENRIRKEIKDRLELIENKNRFLQRILDSIGIPKDMLNNFLRDPAGTMGAIRAELYSAEKQLYNAKLSLDDGKQKIEEGKRELNSSNLLLITTKNKLDQAKSTLDDSYAALNDGKARLKSEYANIESVNKELTRGQEKLKQGQLEYDRGIKNYQDQYQLYVEEKSQGQKELNTSYQTLEAGEKQYKSGYNQLKDSSAELSIAETKIDIATGDYSIIKRDQFQNINIGYEIIDNSREDISELELPEFIYETRDDDQSYKTIYDNPFALEYLVIVFSSLALAVAVLVISTTIKRFIDEDRGVLGTFKGLGLSGPIISIKYILFGGISGLTGGILGSLAGQKILGPMIYDIYMSGTIFSTDGGSLSTVLILISIAISLVTTIGVIIVTINSSLKENPATLMRPKAPKSGETILLERIDPLWDRLSFIGRITARNIFRYKGRMLMTILGVAVCMALLVLGFSMEYGISGIVNSQFEDIYKYTDIAYLEEDEDVTTDIEEILKSPDIQDLKEIHIDQLTLESPDNENLDVTFYVDLDGNFEDYVSFIDNKDSFRLDDSGVIITKKLANILDLDIDDSIEVELDKETYQFNISGIMENHLGHGIYSGDEYYSNVIDDTAQNNALLIKADKDVVDYLSDYESVLAVISNTTLVRTMESVTDSLDDIIIIIIAIAMLLAMVVLYSLTDINISERVRELATMKVLGFYPLEVTEYVFRETFILSLIGVVLGSGLGKLIVDFILDKFAPSYIMFADPNYPMSILLSASMTVVFTLIIMLIMHIKLKSLDMLEALGSIE